MPLEEIPYRFMQIFRRHLDKFLTQLNQVASQSVAQKKKVWEKIDIKPLAQLTLDPADAKISVEAANALVNHEFDVFGIAYKVGTTINFHKDPKTGKVWPLRFWGDIDYRRADAIGGIKFAWELNRLHHLPRLGLTYALTGNRVYFDEIFTQLQDWLDYNPYPQGINWISGIELGIRIVNLVYALKLVGVEALEPRHKDTLATFVFLHGRHLYRYPSKYSSCANHALAEALGMYASGLAFPGFPMAKKWSAFGGELLKREITRQVYPDGSSFEHSVPYLQFVLDHFLIYFLLTQEYYQTRDEIVANRLIKAFEFIAATIDDKGNLPLIGDDDDGYLLKVGVGEQNNFISLLNTGSILFDRPDWIHPSATLDTKTIVLLGHDVKVEWERLRSKQAWHQNSYYFPDAGLAVIVDNKGARSVLFVGNSGPLGLIPLSGHGHADALSFWLSINGQPFFVDPGTYLYHSGGKWRRYFRSTAAHNTVQVDGFDQADQIADFIFADPYKVKDIEWSETDDRVLWSASHDGYQRLPDPVLHRRRVTYKKNEYTFHIVDELRCRDTHEIQIYFHFHPDVQVEALGKNTYRLSANNTKLLLQVDAKLESQSFCGSVSPLRGWYSATFNRLEKTHTLVFEAIIDRDSKFSSEVNVI